MWFDRLALHAGGELDLEPDRRSEERVLEAFGTDFVEISVKPGQLVVGNEACALRTGVFLNVPPRVRAVLPDDPELAGLNILRSSERQRYAAVAIVQRGGYLGYVESLDVGAFTLPRAGRMWTFRLLFREEYRFDPVRPHQPRRARL